MSSAASSSESPADNSSCPQGGVGTSDGRLVECLDRGVIAVPKDGDAFISWRLLGTESSGTAFNLYRQNTANAAPSLVCSRTAAEPTWCIDSNDTSGAQYFVRAVDGAEEGNPSNPATLQAQDYLRIPLRAASPGAFVHLGWVGDLNGDGEFDVVVDRISDQAPLVDAYAHDGTFLWRLNTGPLGEYQNNIEGGAATISNGHNDGLTVFDFDSDGRADVAIKTANGFVFGNGDVLRHNNDQDQFISIVDGLTGAEKARAPLPSDYIADGPLQCQFGAGYLDGVRPSVVIKCKNRVGRGPFNKIVAAYDYNGTAISLSWKNLEDLPNFHQLRIMDVDGDGDDEVVDGGHVLDGDGTVMYNLGDSGVVHGDRFHITDMNPNRPGLEGFGIQQDNGSGLETYYYDAATGEMLEEYYAPGGGVGADMARGTVADLFPDSPGMEYWSFNGMYSAATGDIVVREVDRNVPWPNFQIQWDGDVGSELLDNNRVGDWNLEAKERNTYTWQRSFDGLVQARGALPFFGDIFGDWREEVIIENSANQELRIYTTTYETDVRLYTLAHNPAYRNSFTVHGYKQSHHVDYFFGFGMSQPPAPKIRSAGRD